MITQTARITCSNCGVRLKAKTPFPVGKQVTCPKCKSALQLPCVNGHRKVLLEPSQSSPRECNQTERSQPSHSCRSKLLILTAFAIIVMIVIMLLFGDGLFSKSSLSLAKLIDGAIAGAQSILRPSGDSTPGADGGGTGGEDSNVDTNATDGDATSVDTSNSGNSMPTDSDNSSGGDDSATNVDIPPDTDPNNSTDTDSPEPPMGTDPSNVDPSDFDSNGTDWTDTDPGNVDPSDSDSNGTDWTDTDPGTPDGNMSNSSGSNSSNANSGGANNNSPGSGTNSAPVGLDDYFEGAVEDQEFIVATPGVLRGVYDPDNDPLTPTVVVKPSNGELTLNIDGSFTYRPRKDFGGVDSFTFKANDGKVDSNEARVEIFVEEVNDAPVAKNDEYVFEQGASMKIAALGVLANDTDVDAATEPMANLVGTQSDNGFPVVLQSTGSFEYSPSPDFQGVDSFRYTVSDGNLSAEATVTITVKPSNGGITVSTGTVSEKSPFKLLTRLPEMRLYPQEGESDCGPTCVRIVLGYYGMNPALDSVRKACDSSVPRMSLSQRIRWLSVPEGLEEGLERYDVPTSVHKRMTLRDLARLIDQDRPPIILVRSEVKGWHYIVVVGYRTDMSEFRIANRYASGELEDIAADVLDRAWSFEGDLGGRKHGRSCPNPVCDHGEIPCPNLKCHAGQIEKKITQEVDKILPPGKPKPPAQTIISWVKCPTCKGNGHLPCPTCGDFFRVLVSRAVSGRTIIVPNHAWDGMNVVEEYRGKSLGDATFALRERNLNVELVGSPAQSSSRNKVIKQNPPKGTRVIAGSKVAIELEEVVAVPVVTRKSVADATRILESRKLKPVVTTSGYRADDVVLKQQVKGRVPEPGYAYPGSCVELGPVGRRVPNVTGLSWIEAIDTLNGAGLKAASTLGEVGGECVMAQNPRSGRLTDPSRPVVLTPGVRTPSVVRMSIESAQQQLRSVGLKSAVQGAQNEFTTDARLADRVTVVAQNPSPRQTLPVHGTVALRVLRYIHRAAPSETVPPSPDGHSGNGGNAKPTVPVSAKSLTTYAMWMSPYESWVRFNLSADRQSFTTNIGVQGQLTRRVTLNGKECLEYSARDQSRGWQTTITIPADGNGRGSIGTFQTTPPSSAGSSMTKEGSRGAQTSSGNNRGSNLSHGNSNQSSTIGRVPFTHKPLLQLPATQSTSASSPVRIQSKVPIPDRRGTLKALPGRP